MNTTLGDMLDRLSRRALVTVNFGAIALFFAALLALEAQVLGQLAGVWMAALALLVVVASGLLEELRRQRAARHGA